jgi:hypothetical protein
MHGLLRLVIFLLQLGGALWPYFARAGKVMAWLGCPLIDVSFLVQLALSQTSPFIALFSLLTLLVRFCKNIEALESSFC